MRFERMGVFAYSLEEGTSASLMDNQIPERVKVERRDSIMLMQQEISQDVCAAFIGKTLRVLIDEKQVGEENIYLGRSQYDSPDVDGVVYVHSKSVLEIGKFVEVMVKDAVEYDLIGEVI